MQKAITCGGDDVEKWEPSYVASGHADCAVALESGLAIPQEVKHRVPI